MDGILGNFKNVGCSLQAQLIVKQRKFYQENVPVTRNFKFVVTQKVMREKQSRGRSGSVLHHPTTEQPLSSGYESPQFILSTVP